MMSSEKPNDDHVSDLLSGYIDGELTQQDRQRVRLHCESCSECNSSLEDFREMRGKVANAKLSELSQDKWRETMNDATVKTTRGLGWLLLVGGAMISIGVLMLEMFTSDSSMSIQEKLIVGGIYGGLLLLFLSVLRQRLIERKSDKYKDVEI
jgi:hypothetical protein